MENYLRLQLLRANIYIIFKERVKGLFDVLRIVAWSQIERTILKLTEEKRRNTHDREHLQQELVSCKFHEVANQYFLIDLSKIFSYVINPLNISPCC